MNDFPLWALFGDKDGGGSNHTARDDYVGKNSVSRKVFG